VGAESFYSMSAGGPVEKGTAEAFAVLGYKSGHLIGPTSGGNSIGDTRKIATGPKGSGASIGKTSSIEVVNSSSNVAVLLVAMTNGSHDGVFLLAPPKQREITKLLASSLYKLLNLNEWAEGGHTARFSFIRPATIPAGTYLTQSNLVSTICTQLVLASPAKTAQTAGEVGPGTAGIGSDAAIPVSAGAVKSIREALGPMDVIDPAIPVHGSLVAKITVVDKSLPFSADISIINILMILFTVWVGYLVFLPSPRDCKMLEDV